MDHDLDDSFAELGLKPGATEQQVKAAWRRLVSQWHPDRNPSAAALARMQRINRAFKAIRQRGFMTVDAGVAASDEPAAPERPRPRPSRPESDGRDETKDRPPGRTIRRRVRLSLEDAARGCTKVLRGRVVDPCTNCHGAGYRVLGGHCRQCLGSGAVRQPSWFGWLGARSECGACHGNGIAREGCAVCAGSGKQPALDYRVSVRIPGGVRDGDELHVDARRLKSGAAPGDLAIRIELAPHPLLRLDDDGTIRCEVPVDGFVWMANRQVEVPTLAGPCLLALDRDRLVYRMRGRGFPVTRRGAPADQLVSVTPVFPTHIGTDQQILLDQLIAANAARRAADASADDRLSRWERDLREWKRASAGEP